MARIGEDYDKVNTGHRRDGKNEIPLWAKVLITIIIIVAALLAASQIAREVFVYAVAIAVAVFIVILLLMVWTK